jgi:hypothetical protein
MLPKHSAAYRQLQTFSELIGLVKESKPMVYQRLLETYQRHAASLFASDIQMFYENVRQKMDSIPGKSKHLFN